MTCGTSSVSSSGLSSTDQNAWNRIISLIMAFRNYKRKTNNETHLQPIIQIDLLAALQEQFIRHRYIWHCRDQLTGII